MMKEFAQLYEAYKEGKEPGLKELEIQYGDYAVWQREWLQGEVLEKELGYWREQLAGLEGVELPVDHGRPAVVSYRGGRKKFRISGEVSERLKELGRREGATMFMTLLAGLQALLSRYSGQEDVGVGSVIANRNRGEVEGLIGFFVNTLVLRGDVSGNPSFRELLGRVRETALQAHAHQDLPFEKLVEELEPERDLSRQPLFQVMFILQNAPWEEVELSGLRVKMMEVELGEAKFDLSFLVGEVEDGLEGEVEYAADLFEEETIEQMVRQYERVLEQVGRNGEVRVAELELLEEEERRQLLLEVNQTQREFPQKTLVELFERQASRTPTALAMTCVDQTFTYVELNERANQMAWYLRKHGVGP